MWGAHWRDLANTIAPSMFGGDAAFLSNNFDHLLGFRTGLLRGHISAP